MKYFITLVVLFGIGAIYYWWTIGTQLAPETTVPTTQAESQVAAEVIVTDGVQQYHNEEWGIMFEYPSDWGVYENTFKTSSSFLNVVVQPIEGDYLPRPIIANVISSDWGQTLYNRAVSKGEFTDTVLDSKRAIIYESTDMGLPTIVYLLQTDRGFWVTIIAKVDYEDTLNQVISSLKITPVDNEDSSE